MEKGVKANALLTLLIFFGDQTLPPGPHVVLITGGLVVFFLGEMTLKSVPNQGRMKHLFPECLFCLSLCCLL